MGKKSRYYNNDPREIRARFDSVCAETGKVIKAGDECVYYPNGKKVFSMDSKQAESFRGWKFDCEILKAYY